MKLGVLFFSVALCVGALSSCGKGDDTGEVIEPYAAFPGEAPTVWDAGLNWSDSSFPVGLQSGDPNSDSIVLWSRYAGAESVEMLVVAHDGNDWEEVLRETVTPDDGGFIHRLVEGLAEDTWHSFTFSDSQGTAGVGSFRTPPESGLRVVTFGGVSCTKHGYEPFPALSAGATQGYAFTLLAGDQVYSNASDLEGKRAEWEQNISTAGYRDLLASAPSIATWDDHEVANDWGIEHVDSDRVEAGKEAFFDYMATRPRYGEELYRSIRYSDTLEVFVLDVRSERDPEAGQYVSPEQLQWVIDGLDNSTAVFKLILTSVPFADFESLIGDVAADDRWQGYPEQRSELIDTAASHDNVYFLSGDFHLGFISRVDPADGAGFDLYDVLMGPGGNVASPIGDLLLETDQFLLGLSARNTTRFTADPLTETLFVEFIGEDGEVLRSMELPAPAPLPLDTGE
jgi:alkaline phosphatase D